MVEAMVEATGDFSLGSTTEPEQGKQQQTTRSRLGNAGGCDRVARAAIVLLPCFKPCCTAQAIEIALPGEEVCAVDVAISIEVACNAGLHDQRIDTQVQKAGMDDRVELHSEIVGEPRQPKFEKQFLLWDDSE